MAVTETTTTSWTSRLGSSVKGVIAGLIMFIAGFPVLFLNEGRTVDTRKALEEGEAACIPVESIEAIDPEMNGQLVHMTGLADTQDILADAQFGISDKAIRLSREVEMYQWKENSHSRTQKKLGGGEETVTTYTHELVWDSDVLQSPTHPEPGQSMVNPGSMEFVSQEQVAETVTFGAFRLAKDQIARIGDAIPYSFPTNWVSPLERTVRSGTWLYVPAAATRKNTLDSRDVVASPQIGDMRVKFTVVKPHDISIVAKQKGDTFVSYVAKTKKKVNLLADGVEDAAEMFADAQSANTIMCWLLRLGGFILMFFGLNLVLKPLSVLGDVLPILGNIIEIGSGIVAFVCALVCALVTIAIAWLFYRPLLGIALLAAAGGLVWWLRARKLKAAAVQTAS